MVLFTPCCTALKLIYSAYSWSLSVTRLGYLQSVADGETDKAGVDGVAAEHGEHGREEYDQVTDHLEPHGQPAVGDAARVVATLVVVDAALRLFHKPTDRCNFMSLLLYWYGITLV